MAAPSHIGSTSTPSNTTTPKTLAAGTRAVGDLIVVFVGQIVNDATSVFAVTDDRSNAYTLRAAGINANTNHKFQIWSAVVESGKSGSITVSVARTTGTLAFSAGAAWASAPAGTAIHFDDADADATTTNGTSHASAPSGEIDASQNSIVYAGLTTSTGSITTLTVPSGFTSAENQSQRFAFARRETTVPLADERGIWTTDVSAQSAAAIASFRAVPTGRVAVKLQQHGPFVGGPSR